jgi:hypothetical protein
MPNEEPTRISFEIVLTDLLKCFKGMSVVVIGGIAASLLGRPRFTQDIDILVMLENEKWVREFADVLETPEIWKDVKEILFKTAPKTRCH